MDPLFFLDSLAICSDCALVISPLKSLFSWGELADILWNCLSHWSWLRITFFFSLARGSLSSRNDEKQNSYILELRKGRVECPSIGRVICLEGIVLSSLDANETRKRDLWSCQQDMVCWWCLKFTHSYQEYQGTRVRRPLLFCTHFPSKYPLFSPFSALQFVWRIFFFFEFKTLP